MRALDLGLSSIVLLVIAVAFIAALFMPSDWQEIISREDERE